MVADALGESGEVIFAALMLALCVLSIVMKVRRQRREEALIRRWCDKKGYSISRIEAENTSIDVMLRLARLLLWRQASARGWGLTVNDSEGGQKDIVVRVKRSGHVQETLN